MALQNSAIKVYPNPSNGHITIDSKDDFSIEILNSVGQIIMSQKTAENILTMDLQYLIKGVYGVKIKTQKNTIVKKVVLQ